MIKIATKQDFQRWFKEYAKIYYKNIDYFILMNNTLHEYIEFQKWCKSSGLDLEIEVDEYMIKGGLNAHK